MYLLNPALYAGTLAGTQKKENIGTHMSLTDKAIKSLKPKGKFYAVADSNGLNLRIMPNSKKYWRYRYQHLGKEKMLGLGIYPLISLAEARAKRDKARKLLLDGIDPSAHRKTQKLSQHQKQENSFEIITREWFNQQKSKWVDSHANKIIRRFERDLFRHLGKQPLTELTPPQLLAVLRKIEHRSAIETAHRALSNCGRVFRYAIATGRAERDSTQDLKGALSTAKG